MRPAPLPEYGEIRSEAAPNCTVCGSAGATLYGDLRDSMAQAPGRWRLAYCPDPGCGLLWLDPMPIAGDLVHAYRDYYTHSSPHGRSRRALGGPFGWIKQGFLASRFGYRFRAAPFKRALATLLA